MRAFGAAPWTSTSRVRDLLLIALAWTSGYVDVVSYLGLGHVFPANMTGNTVFLGLALAQARGSQILRSALALAGFAAGVAIASPLVDRDRETTIWPPSVTRALALECAVLSLLACGGSFIKGLTPGAMDGLVLLAGCAMGIQSAAIHSLGLPGVATTYITGTWTAFVRKLFSRAHSQVIGLRKSGQWESAEENLSVMAALLGIYVFGAWIGAAAQIHWRLESIFLPALTVAGVALLAFFNFGRPR